MKKFVFAILLVLANFQIIAQDYSKWNTSINFSSGINSSILIVPGVNFSLSNSFEVGFIPSYYQDRVEFSNGITSENMSWGGNMIGKYYIFRENIMDPYVALIVGYESSTETLGNQKSYYDYFNLSILLGNELQIGEKGWNLDFNVGFLYKGFINQNNLIPIYTIGVKKRFLRKE